MVCRKCSTFFMACIYIDVILVVTAVSNGANMTDGLDGLATGTSAIIGTTLGILAYVSEMSFLLIILT